MSSSHVGTVNSMTGKYSGSNFGARPRRFEGFFVVVVARRTSWVTSEREEGDWCLEASLGLGLRVECDWDFDRCFVNG